MATSGFHRTVDSNVAMFFTAVALDIPLAIIFLRAIPSKMPYLVAAERDH